MTITQQKNGHTPSFISIYVIRHTAILLFVLLANGLPLAAQQTNDSSFVYILSRLTSQIRLDGSAEDSAWQDAFVCEPFTLNSPIDNAPPFNRTEVKMLFDESNLYVLAICYDEPTYVIQTLKRDNFGDSDEFAVLIDPIGKKSNGFGVGVNAMGAQSEVIIFPGNVDFTWDNRWYSAVERYPDHWIVEMKIPLKSIRYNESNTDWRVNFCRVDPGHNERSSWAPIPRQFDLADIGFYGTLKWPQAPKKLGGNISLIPYVSIRNDEVNSANDSKIQSGGDAKIALTPSLNLDLTTYSDFSQVEVDAQVTNLTRFNIFFPERRQFFIENNDIFNNYGLGADQAFYSRTIGLSAAGSPKPILYGARITGNLSESLRIGAFNMQTRSQELSPGNNFTGVSFQQRFLDRSSFRGIFLNRQGWTGEGQIENDFGRNVGGDMQFTTSNGQFVASMGYLHSFKPEKYNSENGQLYGGIAYNGQNFRGYIEAQRIGKNYYTDMGFNSRIENYDPETASIVRIGYTNVGSMLNYYIYPSNSATVNYHWSGLENFVWVNSDGTGLNEWYSRLRHFLFFKNTSALRFRLNNNFVRLIYPFGITTPYLPNGDYNMTEFNVQYNSDNRKLWQFELFGVYGQFYNGFKHTYRANVIYRVQPWVSLKVGVEHNDIRFPSPYEDKKITLGTIRSEINFSTKIFWTTFFQYNTQADNFNINSRLQYRFAPMSDVFLVYTDNYAIENDFAHKSRFVVLKLNYWLTL
ncbi:MAG: carbohydrate binding family 9 domain-containing protein [Saprospiraceae bacterium]|nr:carbohydrate binding family 9 domain-containing protein [Saprospiraceae bacterium]